MQVRHPTSSPSVIRNHAKASEHLICGCITTHVHAAKQQGATKEEIAETLGVAIAANAGAALVYSARVMDALIGGTTE